MIELEVYSPDLKEQIKKLDGFDESWRRHTRKPMREAIVLVKGEWQRIAPVDTRKYVESIAGRVRAGLVGEIQGVIGTPVTSAKGFPYPRALEESERYHYRRGPRKGRRTKGRVQKMLKAQKGKIEELFKKATDNILKDLRVR